MKNFSERVISAVAAIGFVVAVYGAVLELSPAYTPGYRPPCDITSPSTCPVLLKSPFNRLPLILNLATKGSIMDITAAQICAGYFALMLTYPLGRAYSKAYLAMSSALSIFLGSVGFLMIFVLKDACVHWITCYILPQIPEVHRSVNVWIFRAAGFQLILTVTFCLALEQFRGARNGLLTESLESNSLHTKMNISPVCPKVHTPNPSVHKPPSVLSSDEKQEKKQE